MSEKNFGHLGTSFQQGLLKTIIEDKKFAVTIIDVVDSKYFDGPYFKYLMENIKELYKLYGYVPDYDTLQQKIMKENKGTSSKVHLDTLSLIQELEVKNNKYIKDTSLNFCKQQVLKKALKDSEEIMINGEFEEYGKIENIIIDALQVGSDTDNVSDIGENIRESLQSENREPFPTGIDGIDDLLKGGLARGELGIILAPTGIGKELPISEPVLTPRGWIKNGELKIGDKIIGSDGKEQYVIGVYPQGIKSIYKIEFTDNTSVNCGIDHLWSVNTLNMRTAKIRGKNNKSAYASDYITIKTSDMISNIKKRGRYNYRLPNISPVEFDNKKILIDPYLLGLLLGDGYMSNNSCIDICTKDDELFDNIKHLNEHSSFNEYYKNDVQTMKRISLKSDIKKRLKEYNLIDTKANNKFIPEDYLYNSINIRLSLLQGLMDIDGHISKKGTCQISTVSEQLSKDIREIVLSLGGTVRINTKIPKYTYNGIKKQGQSLYIITMSFANNIIPFRLLRKSYRYSKRIKYIEQKYVKSITYSHEEEASCIKVSNSDELYVTRDYILTHNTTILTKFANSAFNCGATVLHVFFEDSENIIKKKHYTIWTGIASDDQKANEDEVFQKVSEVTSNRKNRLKLCKMSGFGVSVADIKTKIRKLHAEGCKVDLLILDYVDCISLEKSIQGEEWKGEGTIMRSLEGMTDEFNIAIWTATQGNRDSISSEVVTTDQMGGSIKKAQIGHVVISIAKTLVQKENNLANITLLKSRIGKDGIIFQNCKFDNELLQFSTEAHNTLLGHEEERAESKKQHAAQIYKESLERKQKVREELKDGKDEKKEDSRLNIEMAISKSLDNKESMLNQLENLMEDKEIKIDIPSVNDIQPDILMEDQSSIVVTQTMINKVEKAQNSNRAADVYKANKLKKQIKSTVDNTG